MRVAYVFTDLPDLDGTFAHAELLGLARRGVEIEIFCLRTNLSRRPAADRLRERFRVHQVGYLAPRALVALLGAALRHPVLLTRFVAAAVRDTRRTPPIFVKTLAILPKSVLFGRSLRGRGFDLIVAYWAGLPGRAALWMSELSGVPYAGWAHAGADIYNRKYQTEEALKSVLTPACLILTCNRTNLAYFERLLPPATMARVRYQPHGIDVEQFRPDAADSERSGVATESGPIRLLSVGRLSEPKGYHFAIRACRLLRERGVAFHYRIIGEGGQRAELERLIAEYHLVDRVELSGELEHDRLAVIYRASHIFLAPSVVTAHGGRDGLPNVLLEAMACGMATIGSDAVGIPEAIEHERSGLLVPPADPASLAAAIAALAGDPEKRARLGAEARVLVMQRYGREECLDRVAAILAETILAETILAGAVAAGAAAVGSGGADREPRPRGRRASARGGGE